MQCNYALLQQQQNCKPTTIDSNIQIVNMNNILGLKVIKWQHKLASHIENLEIKLLNLQDILRCLVNSRYCFLYQL